MTRKKMEHSFIKSLSQCSRGPATYKGEKLSERDYYVARDAITIWLFILRDVCVGELSRNEGRIRALATKVADADLFDFLSSLDFVADWLLQSVADESLRDYQRLKCAVVEGVGSAEPIRDVLGLAKSHLLGWFRHNNLTDFAASRQIFCFLGRLNLEDNLCLTAAAYEQWWEAENDMSQRYDYSGDEKDIISEWFPLENAALLYANFSPHHGGGTVYEGVRSTGAKALLNGYDDRLRDFYRIAGWDVSFSGMMQKPWFLPAAGYQPACPTDRHKILDVPKNWKVKRFVSEEPAAYMFAELGMSDAICDYLHLGVSALSYHYCINTEGWNREYARLGSIDGSFATIDLSHASDSVSFDLVCEWFSESCLDATVRHLRTQYAEFDVELPDFWGPHRCRDVIAVSKFAPMGSGLTFQIESICFGAIAESAVRHTCKGTNRKWFVYGDDMVIPVEALPWALRELRAKGFTPNVRKSFFNTYDDSSGDFFRESCGGEYLNGYDVTPKRISRKFNGLSIPKNGKGRSRSITQLVSLANDLYDLRTARTYVVSALLAAGVPILFDTDGFRGIKTTNPHNHHLRKRWNSAYQRWEVKAVIVVTGSKKLRYHEDDYLGEARLFEYLRLANKSHRTHLLYPEDMVSERMDPYSSEPTVLYSWVELPEAPESSSQ